MEMSEDGIASDGDVSCFDVDDTQVPIDVMSMMCQLTRCFDVDDVPIDIVVAPQPKVAQPKVGKAPQPKGGKAALPKGKAAQPKGKASQPKGKAALPNANGDDAAQPNGNAAQPDVAAIPPVPANPMLQDAQPMETFFTASQVDDLETQWHPILEIPDPLTPVLAQQRTTGFKVAAAAQPKGGKAAQPKGGKAAQPKGGKAAQPKGGKAAQPKANGEDAAQPQNGNGAAQPNANGEDAAQPENGNEAAQPNANGEDAAQGAPAIPPVPAKGAPAIPLVPAKGAPAIPPVPVKTGMPHPQDASVPVQDASVPARAAPQDVAAPDGADEDWECTLCLRMKSASERKYQHSLRKSRCGSCNALRTRCFGSGLWGDVIQLTKPDVSKFFQQHAVRPIATADLQSTLNEFKAVHNIEAQRRETLDNGCYLPLSVWAQKGFDTAQIIQDCVEAGDTKLIKGMGLCYRLVVEQDKNIGTKGWETRDTTSTGAASSSEPASKAPRVETPAETAKRLRAEQSEQKANEKIQLQLKTSQAARIKFLNEKLITPMCQAIPNIQPAFHDAANGMLRDMIALKAKVSSAATVDEISALMAAIMGSCSILFDSTLVL